MLWLSGCATGAHRLPYESWRLGFGTPNYMEEWIETADVVDRCIHGPARLSRRPCRSSPCATIPLGLLKGRGRCLSASAMFQVAVGFRMNSSRQARVAPLPPGEGRPRSEEGSVRRVRTPESLGLEPFLPTATANTDIANSFAKGSSAAPKAVTR
ncbi:hypothetical protein D9M68_867600 [compost metagenome]